MIKLNGCENIILFPYKYITSFFTKILQNLMIFRKTLAFYTDVCCICQRERKAKSKQPYKKINKFSIFFE